MRKTSHKILGGVCSGFAEYAGMNLGLVRVIWILFSLFFCIGFVAYLLLWMIVPADTARGAAPARPVAEPAPAKVPDTAYAAGEAPLPAGEPRQAQAFNLEKYVGESLIGKIGIVILIIGVGIGVKYSIDNNLISPAIRIALGYLVGALLLVAGWRLRGRYANFAATLVSGSMAILYFMTFAAYAFYAMFPQWAAFALMVAVTVATVALALKFNRQIVGIIGLVGAYCIPFLLDEGQGRPEVLFTYMGIINTGVLFVALKKYWKPFYLFSFGTTWLIFLAWYGADFDWAEHHTLAWGFLVVFFLIFQTAFLAYKLIKREVFQVLDVALLLINSFIFYGLGYSLLEQSEGGASYLGAFTLLNALFHALSGILIYRNKQADKNVFYLVLGMALVFLTLSIPVQLDGNWVTLLWLGEATLLFWMGRSKQAGLYETIAYPVLALALLSLWQDWAAADMASRETSAPQAFTPFLNAGFMTSLLFAGALGYLNFLALKRPSAAAWLSRENAGQLVAVGLPALLILVVYAGPAVEISNYWNRAYAHFLELEYSGAIYEMDDRDITELSEVGSFRSLWLLAYSMAFVSLLAYVNHARIKSRVLEMAGLGLTALVVVLFLTTGLYELSELRESYLRDGHGSGFAFDARLILRYLCLALLALLLAMGRKVLKDNPAYPQAGPVFDLVLATTTAWVLTSELLQWLDLAGVSDSYKLWVSILWGVYALALIGLGIWKKKRHLRIAAIALFSLTLVKLFVYDIAHLNTLSKTLVFVSLGVILLIVSFLYNRYKQSISGED